jgi:ornithine cyclodeaminase
MNILTLDQIKKALANVDLLPAIEAGFAAYSQNGAVVPPVGELILEQPYGEVHLKYGYIKADDYYVIKIASGFYDNPKLGLPSSSGLMLVFSQQTGQLQAVLLDEGHLTDVRTAAAGAVAAKYLAPAQVEQIGILGTGMQARLQLEHLAPIRDCRQVLVWGRTPDNLSAYSREIAEKGYQVKTTQDAAELAGACQLIVTTTASTEPLLQASAIQPGTHITAMGADMPHKQELDPALFARAELVVADSISQCLTQGDIHHGVAGGYIQAQELVELGQIVAGDRPGRTGPDQITIADLTGVAVQDIQIAKAVYEQAGKEKDTN